MKLGLIVILLASLTSLYAGTEVGNGGDVIICYDKPLYHSDETINTSAVMVGRPLLKDYWEMEETMGALRLSLGEVDLDYRDKVLLVLDRLQTVDSERSVRLRKRFFNPSFYHLAARSKIPEIDDATMVLDPRDQDFCYDTQIAIQFKNPRPLQSKVLIDRNLFMLLSEDHKAGLILHELLYEEEIKYKKVTNSDLARWFNAVVSSNFIENLADIDASIQHSNTYSELIKKMKLDYMTRVGRIPDPVQPISLVLNGIQTYIVDANERTGESFDDSADGYCIKRGYVQALSYTTGNINISPLVALDLSGNVIKTFKNNSQADLSVIISIDCE